VNFEEFLFFGIPFQELFDCLFGLLDLCAFH